MNLQECYDEIGGDYKDAITRMRTDERLQRYVIKFLSDKSFERLGDAIQAANYEMAFREAHTLKGVVQNLSFVRLIHSASELTELLRGWEKAPIDENNCRLLWEQVKQDYSQIRDAVSRLSE